jgi:Flp pilus assembly protein TadD
MLKTVLAASAMVLVIPLATTAANARELVADGVTILPVAFDELRSGRTEAAITKLQADNALSPRDPSRLINLGSAYARLGRDAEAAAMYRAAMASPIRYDLELASGEYMDSRWAARMALTQLESRPRGTVTIAQVQ